MCGRICIHLFGKSFGDINNEYCHLGGMYETLLDKVNGLNELEYDFCLDNDYNIFSFLDDKLYIDDVKKTLVQIKRDSELYYRFDFLTNSGGEPFDRTKSFIYVDKKKMVHILFQNHDNNDEIICSVLDKRIFESVTKQFIEWYKKTFDNVKK
ncbi:hypothetical protein FACS1894106_5310 [Spirochaetia bacterium]|nr:hypothetical protein FACS1894106_5310 [Spirochaetia bacterium]